MFVAKHLQQLLYISLFIVFIENDTTPKIIYESGNSSASTRLAVSLPKDNEIV